MHPSITMGYTIHPRPGAPNQTPPKSSNLSYMIPFASWSSPGTALALVLVRLSLVSEPCRSSCLTQPSLPSSLPLRYGIGAMLKDGHKHLSGLEEAVVKNLEACKQLSQITRTSLGPNGEESRGSSAFTICSVDLPHCSQRISSRGSP